jgi:hypothetical protein
VVAAIEEALLITGDDHHALVDARSGAELWTLRGPEDASATAVSETDGTMFVSIIDDDAHDSTVMALQTAQ